MISEFAAPAADHRSREVATPVLCGLTLLKARSLPDVVALPLNGELNVLADARYFFHLAPSG